MKTRTHQRAGTICLIAGRGLTSVGILLAILASLVFTYVAIKLAIDGELGAGLALWFIAMPAFDAGIYFATTFMAVPLLWLGERLNPDSQFVVLD